MKDAREIIAKTVGDHYDGYVDRNDTPHTWGSAVSASDAILSALAENGLVVVEKYPSATMTKADAYSLRELKGRKRATQEKSDD